MTRITVKSEIVVGKRTANGNVYTKEALEGSIRHFNEKAKSGKVFGGFVDRQDLNTIPLQDASHVTLGAEIDQDDRVTFHIKTLDTPQGKILEKMMSEDMVKYMPIMEVGLDQPKIIDGVKTITEIKDLRGIGIEMSRPIGMSSRYEGDAETFLPGLDNDDDSEKE